MQVVINKCKREKKLAQIRLVDFEKHKNRLTLMHSNSEKNDITKQKARLL